MLFLLIEYFTFIFQLYDDELKCFLDLRYVDEFSLSESYCSRHFLVGLLFQEFIASLREPRDYRRRTIALFRNLLAKHAADKRYTNAVGFFSLWEHRTYVGYFKFILGFFFHFWIYSTYSRRNQRHCLFLSFYFYCFFAKHWDLEWKVVMADGHWSKLTTYPTIIHMVITIVICFDLS